LSHRNFNANGTKQSPEFRASEGVVPLSQQNSFIVISKIKNSVSLPKVLVFHGKILLFHGKLWVNLPNFGKKSLSHKYRVIMWDIRDIPFKFSAI
jgi:hypothetical protein